MKPILRIIPVLLAAATLATAQDEPNVDSNALVSVPVSTTAHILGEIPDGTPPAPQAPKPEFVVPAENVLKTTSHAQGGRTITIRQIKPIALPPPPAPVTLTEFEADEQYRTQLAEYREEHAESGLLFLGATVFRSGDSPPRTLVRWWPEGNGGTITFWSSADFALIAGGINSFVDASANTHHLLMGYGNVDIARMSELQAAEGREYDAPELPDFPAGQATFEIVGNPPAAEDLVPIQALHELYNNNLAELQTAYEGREQARIDREVYLKAHPPQPKDITINYWRTEKPAANGKGAAR